MLVVKIVEQRLELVLRKEDGGGLLSAVDFASLYYGETRVVRALLVNNGPQPMAYSTITTLHDTHEIMHIPPRFRGERGGGGASGMPGRHWVLTRVGRSVGLSVLIYRCSG